MSKSSDWHANTADDRADATALEVAELRAEVEQLRKANAGLLEACYNAFKLAALQNPALVDRIAEVVSKATP